MVESVKYLHPSILLGLMLLFSGDYVVEKPMVLGHESAGIVSQGRLWSFLSKSSC